MTLQSTSTAKGWARDLQDKLTLRFKNAASGINTVSASLDANGWPMLTLSVGGNVSEGQPVIGIRIFGDNAFNSTDIFGNSTIPFAPHICQVGYELTSGGAPECSIPNLVTCMYEVAKLGTIVQQVAIANGTAVTSTSMAAATPVQSLDSIDWPVKGA